MAEPVDDPGPGAPRSDSWQLPSVSLCPEPGLQLDTDGQLTAVLGEPVQLAHAPVARNDAERFVFRQLFESLVSVDCAGAVRPGLARSWRADPEGRVWTFRLRGNLRWADGSPVRGLAVRDAWERVEVEHPRLAVWGWLDPDSVRAFGDELEVALRRGVGRVPVLFSHPALALTARGPGGTPVGTGAFRVMRYLTPGEAILEGETAPQAIDLEPNPFHPEPPRGLGVVTVRLEPGADLRDLAGRADVLVPRNRDTIEYLQGLGGFTLRELPWDRYYVWLAAEPSRPMHRRLRGELVRRVVEAPGMIWESWGPMCSNPFERVRWATSERVDVGTALAVPVGDPDALALAERLAALTGITVERVDAASWSERLARGEAAEFVVPVRPALPVACGVGWELCATAPWAWCAAGGCGEGPAPAGGGIVDASAPARWSDVAQPLLATRATLAFREGLAGFTADADGVVRLHGAGWLRQAAP